LAPGFSSACPLPAVPRLSRDDLKPHWFAAAGETARLKQFMGTLDEAHRTALSAALAKLR
jgi:hypothetical protein